SALYRGKDIVDKYSGKVFHMNSESGNQVFERSDKFNNDDIITAEVNMHLEKEERTLHFFVNNQWQNCSFQNLPDSIKFCVQLSYANTSVSILTMEKLPNPTENKNIKSICEIICHQSFKPRLPLPSFIVHSASQLELKTEKRIQLFEQWL
ncbi:MAG: hypothetical protein EZS28_012372, partial [Streblomastix strix]